MKYLIATTRFLMSFMINNEVTTEPRKGHVQYYLKRGYDLLIRSHDL